MDNVREYLYFYPENVLRTYIHVNYLVLVCFFKDSPVQYRDNLFIWDGNVPYVRRGSE